MATSRDFLGTYRLTRLIRVGQTCQVWEAVSDTGSKKVALKALQPEVRLDKVEIDFLRHEYEVGKDLKHPYVIEVYDFHTDRDIAYVVLELSAFKNLKLTIREGVERIHHLAPKIIEQSAEGLAYFHKQGWVHRDVKPDNYLVSDDGDVKLIDFALAVKQRSGLGKLLGGKTKIQGTRSYMSPEQIRGKPLDERADIYSYGCMMFELMTGKVPFTGSTPEDLLRKHLRSAVPSMLTQNSNVTTEFNDLVASLMAKEPKDRPKSMDDFITATKHMRIFRRMPKPPEDDLPDDDDSKAS